jgi:hypothetical protein
VIFGENVILLREVIMWNRGHPTHPAPPRVPVPLHRHCGSMRRRCHNCHHPLLLLLPWLPLLLLAETLHMGRAIKRKKTKSKKAKISMGVIPIFFSPACSLLHHFADFPCCRKMKPPGHLFLLLHLCDRTTSGRGPSFRISLSDSR